LGCPWFFLASIRKAVWLDTEKTTPGMGNFFTGGVICCSASTKLGTKTDPSSTRQHLGSILASLVTECKSG
jgi:hypothetical protein